MKSGDMVRVKSGDMVRVNQGAYTGRTGVAVGDPVQGTGGQTQVQVKLNGPEAAMLFPESSLEVM